jgi:DNA-binding NarL/FixJ family response regulator
MIPPNGRQNARTTQDPPQTEIPEEPSMPAQLGACSALLSRREVQVLDLLTTGLGDAEIGKILHLSTHTIKGHVNRAAIKLHVNSDKTGHRILLAKFWECPIFRLGAGLDDG